MFVMFLFRPYLGLCRVGSWAQTHSGLDLFGPRTISVQVGLGPTPVWAHFPFGTNSKYCGQDACERTCEPLDRRGPWFAEEGPKAHGLP